MRQVTAAVHWEESVRLLIEEGVNTFVEVGPGKVLTGLLRQIERSVATLNVEDEDEFAEDRRENRWCTLRRGLKQESYAHVTREDCDA